MIAMRLQPKVPVRQFTEIGSTVNELLSAFSHFEDQECMCNSTPVVIRNEVP